MSVCTFLASDCPLPEMVPSKKYPVHIDIDNGIIDDGGADDNFFLLSFRDVQDYTNKKYGGLQLLCNTVGNSICWI